MPSARLATWHRFQRTSRARLKERGVTVDPDHILAVELGHRRAGNALRVAWADELGISPRDIHFESELREIVTTAGENSGDGQAA